MLINLSDEFIEKYKDEEEIKTLLIIRKIENEVLNTFLSPREIRVYKMMFVEGLSFVEIAKEFSVLMERIRQIWFLASRKLRCRECRCLIKSMFKENNIEFGLEILNYWHDEKYHKNAGVNLIHTIFCYVYYGPSLNPKYFDDSYLMFKNQGKI